MDSLVVFQLNNAVEELQVRSHDFDDRGMAEMVTK